MRKCWAVAGWGFRETHHLGLQLLNMKCVQCGHVTQDVAPKFCSECGKKLSPSVTAGVFQGDENANLPSLSEMEAESLKDKAPPSDLTQSCRVPNVQVDEPAPLQDGLNATSGRKKKKMNKNKGASAGLETTSSSMSGFSSLEDCSLPKQLRDDAEVADEVRSFSSSHSSQFSIVDEPAPLEDGLNSVKSKKKKNKKKRKRVAPEATNSLPSFSSLEDVNLSKKSRDLNDSEGPTCGGNPNLPPLSEEGKEVTGERASSSNASESSQVSYERAEEPSDGSNATTSKKKRRRNKNKGANDSDTTSLTSVPQISGHRSISGNESTNEGYLQNKEVSPGTEDTTLPSATDPPLNREEHNKAGLHQPDKDLTDRLVSESKDNLTRTEKETDKGCSTVEKGRSSEVEERKVNLEEGSTCKKSEENNSPASEHCMDSTPDTNNTSSKVQKGGPSENYTHRDNVSDKTTTDNQVTHNQNPEPSIANEKPNKDEGNKVTKESLQKGNERKKGPDPKNRTTNAKSGKDQEVQKDEIKKAEQKAAANASANPNGEDDVETKGKGSKSKMVQSEDSKTKAKGPEKNSKSEKEETEMKRKNASSSQTCVPAQEQARYTRSTDPANFITVYFHVIVSKDFNIRPEEDKVVVRAGRIKGFNDWKDDICEMHWSRDLKDHGYLFEGHVKMNKENMNKDIPYKYLCLHKKKKSEYEYIYYVDGPEKTDVNRRLYINSNLTFDREWHQYDDICMKENRGFLSYLKSMVTEKYNNISKGKLIAGEIMLDSIFSILSTSDAINVLNFFNQLEQFFFVYKTPYVFVDTARKWDLHKFGVNEVKTLVLNALFKIVKPFLNRNSVTENSIIKDRLVAGLVCVRVVQTYNIDVTKEMLAQICSVLCMEEKPREVLLDELTNVKGVFSKIPQMDIHLRKLCQSCIEQDVEHWIWILPLLHAFSASCNQGDVSTKLKQEDVWAALEGLEYETVIKRAKHSDLLQMMITKKHLLQTDRSLIRSWLCLVPTEKMGTFLAQVPFTVADALTACCYKFPRTYSKVEDRQSVLTKILQKIKDLKDKTTSTDSLLLCCDASLHLHSIVCANPRFNMYELPVLTAEIILSLIGSAVQQEASNEQQPRSELQEIQKVFRETVRLTINWLQEKYSYLKLDSTELKSWNCFLCAGENAGEDINAKWKEHLLSELRMKIKQAEAIDQIKMYCDKKTMFEKYHVSIGKCIENCAIEAVHDACQTQRNILSQLKIGNLRNSGHLVSAIIKTSWPKRDDGNPITDNYEVLQHLMQWTDAEFIFKLYGTNPKSEMPEDIEELVMLSNAVILDATHGVMNGSIQLERLECILENKKQFSNICRLVTEVKEKFPISRLEKVLQWRQQEMQSLKEEHDCVDSLLKMCQTIRESINVDLSEIEERHSENLLPQKLNELVSVKTFDPEDQPSNAVSYYNLSKNVMTMAQKLHTLRKSCIFATCWESEACCVEDSDDFEWTIDDLVTTLFTPCFDLYKQIYEDLKSGLVTFDVVDTFLKDFKNNDSELRAEFRIMQRLRTEDNGQWIDERLTQIKQYHQLHVAFDSAKIVTDLKNCLHLSGDFSTLDTLLHFADDFENYKQKPLSCINDEIMKTKKLLSEITEQRAKCLKEVILRKDFFFWVKEGLEDINELKVFVDLASISAGENDMDVDRVACFHDTVLGYSSLLFELKTDFGFDKLMGCFNKLWNALENDQNLPNKLRDSARHIEWLKTVKESHGSVELSSLSLATTINKKGIYIIQAPKGNRKITADSVLSLTLPDGNEDGEEVRTYNLEELKELLNKLMLMSGKGEQGNVEVEKFSEIFSNVQRLASSFIDLYLAGNMLFRTWEASIYCSDDMKDGIRMKFNVGDIGELEALGSLTELLPSVCKTIENFLEEWIAFMNRERSQLYYLNYYTAEQLVYLCQQFQRRDIQEEALVMLSFIKHECTKVNNVKALYYPKTSCTDPSVGFGSPDKMGFMSKLKKCTNVMEKLGAVWDFSMNYMSSLFPECLDIDRLGRCLAALADAEETPVMRDLHPSLQQGCPNLVLCHRSEILSTTIATYMHSSTQPLPSYDEVLLCTPQTTFEEVALFLRRCLTPGCKGRKIYSLLFADELSYETAYKSEQLFQQLQSQGMEKYNLVILCNSDKEHCYIPSVFSKYKVHLIPQRPLSEIQGYLANHFAVGKDIISAASCFKNGMSVGIVASERAGVGKSLYVKRLHKALEDKFPSKKPIHKIIRLIKSKVDENKVLQTLLPFLRREHKARPIIFHIDITSSVNSGISEFLFKLLVLQYLMDSEGRIWKCHPCQLYIIEILECPGSLYQKQPVSIHHARQSSFTDFFPKISCRSPKEVLARVTENHSKDSGDPEMDTEEFRSECFQRPFQYLVRFQQNRNLDAFIYRKGSVEGTPATCLQMFLLYCGMIDPSWSELRNFTWFLNLQLKDCESSTFCNPEFVGDTLQGFKRFVVNFMILMAKDFATPSLHIADQSPGRQTLDLNDTREEDLAPFLLRKKWESEPHPYIFFNEDHVSMTFIGFHLRVNNAGGVDAINPRNGCVIQNNVMTQQLYEGLRFQRVPFNVDFDKLPRDEKISRLCMVLGIQWPFDPDDTYELTMDNILKILAIKMRFRCGIPVVIMGETGCGKTRLIKFLCHLCKGFAETDNMKLVKVHGGTSADTIYKNILEAEVRALRNKEQFQCDTVLFFDEANTTDAISSIKEALCDHTVDGKPLRENSGLQIIAACNPYRKHTDEMIDRLESAGLGYRVKADETKERLGTIPLRQLVYRVHALPPSVMPLVWDFGQLNNETEKKYIQQIVQRLAKDLGISTDDIQLLTNVLSTSQSYMRKRNDECSFVSLRDVERCIEVFKWFYNHSGQLLQNLKTMGHKMPTTKNVSVWCLVLAVGVCYHASLEAKESYRKAICKAFPRPYNDPSEILQEITTMQDLFLSGVHLRDTIAKNLALKENVFMMVVCIELKIPLFLVGKPGSSKSLAKTIVADAMQGQAAHTELYKSLKQIHLVSFQCSPHSTPEGIIGTFKHCARFQESKNLDEYVSVVVLDEIGLAEDSPKMPLKTLHPLLEDGCIEDDPSPHKKVGFIGISNWALDPAKMNRGIFVSRGDPSENELIESAKGICSSKRLAFQKVKSHFQDFAKAYQKVCDTQKEQNKEFFGLRDFYSLIKMVFAYTKHSQEEPSLNQIARAVLRNFSGKDEINALEIFMPTKGETLRDSNKTLDLVIENIKSDPDDNECRYLLILTKNYAALQILQQALRTEDQQPEIIFGSSFPKDQEYTQICRNINRIKICMETGQMVILLNLQNLYESLYDALNQYYVYLAGQKYVDLGLGTHRVKCRVHPKFRLIVIEEKEVVYKDFPIPLINRLEKHYLDINTVLSDKQKSVVADLNNWIDYFTAAKTEHLLEKREYSPSDVFVGYHSDTCASVVLQITKNHADPSHGSKRTVKDAAKLVLLKCATPDSVVRLGNKELIDEYFKRQNHGSLLDFLHSHIGTESGNQASYTEITTFSRLLTSPDKNILEVGLQNQVKNIEILSLQQFDTEYSFLKKIRGFLEHARGIQILIIQTDFEEGSQGAHLVASAKYSTVNEVNKVNIADVSVFVYFITKLPRMHGGTSYVGFRGGLWQSIHIDDLRKSKDMVSDITDLQHFTISQLFQDNGTKSMHENGKAVESDREEYRIQNPEADVQMADESSERMDCEPTQEPEMEDEEMDTDITNETHTPKVTPGWETAHKPEDLIDTTILIRSCVQNAIGMLRDEERISSRNTRRVDILIDLLSSEDQIKASFLKMLKRRLHLILKDQEENAYSAKEWVIREAANPKALQEAGTFRQTLWKRIQTSVTPILAHLLSILDSDANLDILVNPDVPDFLKVLWMFIFSNEHFLNISYYRSEQSSQANTIRVKNNMNLMRWKTNCIPFSWRIKDYLEGIWAHAQYIESSHGCVEKFLHIFSKAPLGKHLSLLSKDDQDTVFLFYKRDFIILTMNVSCDIELMLMELAFSMCIEELTQSTEDTELTLPWVHLAYHTFKHRLQTLSRITALMPSVLKDLEQKAKEMSNEQMVIDIYAAIACLERLKESLLTSDPNTCLRQVKNIQMTMELICSENYLQDQSPVCIPGINHIRCMWNSLYSMALFVEHVLLQSNEQTLEVEELLQTRTIQLGAILENCIDIKSEKPFLDVVGFLHDCREEVGKSTSRFGMPVCSVCQEDPNEPVCLTCDHIFCRRCITRWLESGRNSCPLCKAILPEDVPIVVSENVRDAIQRSVQFRQRCNGFFIDIVCTMCFKDNTPPDTEVILHLLDLLFTTKDDQNGSRNYTKALSPFDDAVDKTPVIRSVILKLLLKYSFNEIINYAEEYLKRVQTNHILTKEDTTEVYMLFLNCLEDALYERRQGINKDAHLKEDGEFLQHYLQNSQRRQKESVLWKLQDIARIRLALDLAAEVLFEETVRGSDTFLQNVVRFCTYSGNDWHRVYLIRKLANLHGIDAVQRHFKDHKTRWMFPPQIFQTQEQTNQIDLFLVHGEPYRYLRNGLGKALLECKEESIRKAVEESKGPDCELSVHMLLAIFREITMQHGSQNQDAAAAPDSVITYVQKARCLQDREVQQFLQSLLNNSRPILRVFPQMSGVQSAVTGMIVHFAAILLKVKNNLLAPLFNLAFAPNRMQNSFLPTMPEDTFSKAKGALPDVQWYLCPNGHYCAIGECGRPMQISTCVDCGAKVGGVNHTPQPGFQRMQHETDQTKHGHVLGDPKRLEDAVAPDREIPAPAFIVLRLLTHLAMLLGAEEDTQSMQFIVKPLVPNVGTFLYNHIEKCLEQLRNSLGKSADETTTIMHLVFCHMLKNPHQHSGHWPVQFDETWSTKEGRNNWEKHTNTIFVDPVLKTLNADLQKVKKMICNDERISSNPIVKIVYGDPLVNGDRLVLPKDSSVHCSKVWNCRERLSIEYLRHVVQQKNGKEEVPILWKFLEKENELRTVKFLPEILNLQKELVKTFHNSRDTSLQTIETFLTTIGSEGARFILKKHIENYICTWNRLKQSLFTNGEIKLPDDMCQDISLQSEISFLLPRRQGKGLCATALISYLITLHNGFVRAMENYTKEEQKYSISASEVMDVHVISYEVEKDLVPIILSNCQYSVQSGQETLQEFDLRKIQRQIISRFLQGKPLITLDGLPSFILVQDRNYENIFMEVKKRLPQETLPNSTINIISKDLNAYSDVCEALHIVDVTLGFLPTSTKDPENVFTKYIEEDLHMVEETNVHILEALERCRLKHVIALWQLLTALKSEHLLRLKMDPFADVDKAYKQPLNQDSQQKLNMFLEQHGPNLLLLELHEMILLKLKKPRSPDEFKPAWTLRETLGPLLDAKDVSFPELEAYFPEQIALAHCIEAWKITAAKKWKRLQK
ncbi:E3 ubiquitin-protein ligase RNF213 [Spea bombifrons]|uniref:E3 ubiquitin-protein ligase RNF213 n=1 Tax=Spea bombifrons TaxID=233779 RepID=UPI00234A3299|nr:E3 ubiquitin-protein ligase RNF213 [Spea bombifrons]